ncbi:Dynein regulatory complex subunit 3, partial [Clydaea vesicula]
ILKIDNLWGFENITKLQLDNNIIERIENIQFLVNLTWLDLSFNNISVIEGLEGLTKLTDITLYNNRISKIENLDDLVNLNVLSIGNNNLTLLEDVEEAKGKYMDDLIALEEEEKVANSRKEEDMKLQEMELLYQSAHIEGIDKLFNSMFQDDPDFQKLVAIDKVIINDLKDELKPKIDLILEDLSKFCLKRHEEIQEEKSIFDNCKFQNQNYHDLECIKILNEYQHSKKQLFRTIHLNKEVDVDEIIKNLKDNTQELSDILMSHEMQLVEQFEDIIKEFERTYIELSAGITEIGQTSMSRIRELENEFHEKFSETVMLLFDRYNKGDVEEEVEDSIRDLLSDKDALLNTVNQSHDFRLSKFDHQEDILVTGVAKVNELVLNKTHDTEVQRNRNRLCEIITFLEKCNAEIEQLEESSY